MNASKPVANRWYVVSNKDGEGRCLVEANNRAQAFRRACEHYCNAEPATVAQTIDMVRGECDVISAPQTPEQMDIEDELEKEAVPSPEATGAGKEEGQPTGGDTKDTSQSAPLSTSEIVRGKVFGGVIGRAGDVFNSMTSDSGDNNDEI